MVADLVVERLPSVWESWELVRGFQKEDPIIISSSGGVMLEDCTLYVLRRDSQPVGIAFVLEDVLLGPALFQLMNGCGDLLHALVIHPNSRGQGLGTQFLAALLERHPRLGAMACPDALDFWRKAKGMTEYPAQSRRFLSAPLVALQKPRRTR